MNRLLKSKPSSSPRLRLPGDDKDQRAAAAQGWLYENGGKVLKQTAPRFFWKTPRFGSGGDGSRSIGNRKGLMGNVVCSAQQFPHRWECSAHVAQIQKLAALNWFPPAQPVWIHVCSLAFPAHCVQRSSDWGLFRFGPSKTAPLTFILFNVFSENSDLFFFFFNPWIVDGNHSLWLLLNMTKT